MLLNSDAEGNLVRLLKESINEKNLSTRIVIYDHNWDNINYARDILSSDVGSDVYGKISCDKAIKNYEQEFF